MELTTNNFGFNKYSNLLILFRAVKQNIIRSRLGIKYD